MKTDQQHEVADHVQLFDDFPVSPAVQKAWEAHLEQYGNVHQKAAYAEGYADALAHAAEELEMIATKLRKEGDES